ncbi:hypothetical protein [Chromobacterium amazonense]|uniref:hypothetical protein n=1 Tax=Chromobacterium amazonense TaxID=1382803 RepID=UPI0011B2896F|nr:hypothetical protein [Chromobacterium amazonense]
MTDLARKSNIEARFLLLESCIDAYCDWACFAATNAIRYRKAAHRHAIQAGVISQYTTYAHPDKCSCNIPDIIRSNKVLSDYFMEGVSKWLNPWWAVDLKLEAGARVQVRPDSGSLLEEWSQGKGIPIATVKRAGMYGIVTQYEGPDNMRFMNSLYWNNSFPHTVPWVRVLFDDAPKDWDGKVSVIHSESLPAAACRVISPRDSVETN